VEVLSSAELLGRQQKRSIELAAVHREQIEFAFCVRSAHTPVGCAARCSEQNDHDIARSAEATPLDLHSQQIAVDIQREVDTTVLANRAQDRNTGLHGGEHDRLLGDGPFDVPIHHEHMFA
jgi:hypothetical protein